MISPQLIVLPHPSLVVAVLTHSSVVVVLDVDVLLHRSFVVKVSNRSLIVSVSVCKFLFNRMP